MRQPSVSALVLVAWLCAAAPARASEDIDLAKKYFTLGSELFNRGDYKAALAQFEESFKYSRKPELLYNMARCHELLGQHEQALSFYDRYLTSAPENAEVIRSRVANLKQLIAKKREEASRKAAAARKPAPVPVKEPEPTSSSAMSVAGWALVGVGGAALVAGAVLGGLTLAKEAELEQAYADAEMTLAEMQDGEAQGEAMQTGAIVGLAVGGAVAAAGAVLLILNAGKKTEARGAWVAPSLGRQGGGVSAGFSF